MESRCQTNGGGSELIKVSTIFSGQPQGPVAWEAPTQRTVALLARQQLLGAISAYGAPHGLLLAKIRTNSFTPYYDRRRCGPGLYNACFVSRNEVFSETLSLYSFTLTHCPPFMDPVTCFRLTVSSQILGDRFQ